MVRSARLDGYHARARESPMAFSPDGAYLAAEYKGGVRLWRANEIRELASIAGSHVVLFGGGSNLIAVWIMKLPTRAVTLAAMSSASGDPRAKGRAKSPTSQS